MGIAQDYIPVENLNIKEQKKFPNVINWSKKKKEMTLEYEKFVATIFFDQTFDHYSAIMPDGGLITASVKNTAIIVTWISNDKKQYHTKLFRRADLKLPSKGHFFRDTPDKDDYFVSSPNFIDSYAFWTSNIVAHAYELLSYKEQGTIKLFPYVSAEILHKLCNASEKNAGVIKLTKHHNVSCHSINNAFDTLYRTDSFKVFYDHLADEKELLSHIFACNHGLMPPQKCRTFQKRLTEKALLPKDVRNILSIKNNIQR